jgi:Reverse transcriptase (RNA-dependent DNA polymerase)
MKTMMIAFNILLKGAERPPGYKTVHCHTIFDIKMDSLQRKARYVCGGHTTNPPENIVTFASVVSRESVRIAFTLAGLNGLNIETTDVSNAHLNAASRENLVTKCEPKFGSAHMGRWAFIVRALYGSTKSAAASWRAEIVALLQELGFVMCRADNDVMFRPECNANKVEVYKYVLVYSVDFLAVTLDPKSIIDIIDGKFKIKEGSTGQPTQYLGASITNLPSIMGRVVPGPGQ